MHFLDVITLSAILTFLWRALPATLKEGCLNVSSAINIPKTSHIDFMTASWATSWQKLLVLSFGNQTQRWQNYIRIVSKCIKWTVFELQLSIDTSEGGKLGSEKFILFWILKFLQRASKVGLLRREKRHINNDASTTKRHAGRGIFCQILRWAASASAATLSQKHLSFFFIFLVKNTMLVKSRWHTTIHNPWIFSIPF